MPNKNRSSLLEAAPESTILTRKKSAVTRTKLVVKCDCGYENTLTLRGSGAGLNWDQGVTLKNIASDEWLFETVVPFANCEYKVLINDSVYENGPNHVLVLGKENKCHPLF